MTGCEQVRTLLAQKLEEADIPAATAWVRGKMPWLKGAAAVLGVQETRSGAAALWNYLGEQWDTARACPVERYGCRVQLTVFVDLYAPKGAAEEIENACEVLEGLLLTPLAEGLRVESVQRGEIGWDAPGGYLKCRCSAACTALFTAVRTEESAELTDFTLKGMVQG
mgnify:FL=1